MSNQYRSTQLANRRYFANKRKAERKLLAQQIAWLGVFSTLVSALCIGWL